MPFGRNPRFDPRRSSPYCSTTTIVVFVALCLVGVWMMTSSTIVPVDVSSSDTNTEVKQVVTDSVGKQPEDSNVNAPVDTRNGDTSDDSNGAASDESSQKMTGTDVTAETAGETTQEENSVKGYKDTKVESADTSESGTYSDANGKLDSGEVVKEGGEIVKEDGDSKSGGNTKGSQEDRQDRIMEKDTVENGNAEQGNNTDKNSDQTENSEQEKSTAENEEDSTSRKNSDQTESNNQEDSTTGNSDKTPTDDQQQSDRQKNLDQESNVDVVQDDKLQDKIQDTVGQNPGKGTEEDSNKSQSEELGANEMLPSGAQSELLKENNTQNVAWSTQASESKTEKEVQASSSMEKQIVSSNWKLCNTTAGADYIPCLDNEEVIKKLRTTKHYEHRERHCPDPAPTCLVSLPDGYKKSIEWSASRDKIWYHNVPHMKLAVVKGHQNWVKVSGEYLTFPGGGTQFKHGALHYIDIIKECGASHGGRFDERHYVAYFRGVQIQGNNELAWFRASNLDVRGVTLNQVLNNDAYILFYERM